MEQRCVNVPITFWRVGGSPLSSHHQGELGKPPRAGPEGSTYGSLILGSDLRPVDSISIHRHKVPWPFAVAATKYSLFVFCVP